MANFEQALRQTLRYEGFYSHDVADPGGETIFGVSRRSHPQWGGWALVDLARAQERLDSLARDERMQKEFVGPLYRDAYWNPLGLDRIEDDAVAAKVFDIAVNMGTHKAAEILQRAVNYILPHDAEVSEDGAIGSRTVSAANAVNPGLLWMALAGEQYRHYQGLVESETTHRFEVFAGGWLKRSLGRTTA